MVQGLAVGDKEGLSDPHPEAAHDLPGRLDNLTHLAGIQPVDPELLH
jgi:hypothetical protein